MLGCIVSYLGKGAKCTNEKPVLGSTIHHYFSFMSSSICKGNTQEHTECLNLKVSLIW